MSSLAKIIVVSFTVLGSLKVFIFLFTLSLPQKSQVRLCISNDFSSTYIGISLFILSISPIWSVCE